MAAGDKAEEKPAFVKGGKPGPGRPKRISALAARCREQRDKVVEVWVQVLRNQKLRASDRIRAGELLMAYGYGKPRQQHEVTGAGGEPLIPAREIVGDPSYTAAVLRHLAGVGEPPPETPP